MHGEWKGGVCGGGDRLARFSHIPWKYIVYFYMQFYQLDNTTSVEM